LTGARPRNHEPAPGDGCALHRPLILQDECPRPASDASGHALDADEARLVFAAGGLQERGDALAGNVAGEVLDHMDPHERRSIGWLIVRRRLVGLDVYLAGCACALLIGTAGSHRLILLRVY